MNSFNSSLGILKHTLKSKSDSYGHSFNSSLGILKQKDRNIDVNVKLGFQFLTRYSKTFIREEDREYVFDGFNSSLGILKREAGILAHVEDEFQFLTRYSKTNELI